MDSHRAPNHFSFDSTPAQPIDGDLGDALASKNRLTENLSRGLDGILHILESLDDKIASADGGVVGESREFFQIIAFIPHCSYLLPLC
jgi:hypothetical protein